MSISGEAKEAVRTVNEAYYLVGQAAQLLKDNEDGQRVVTELMAVLGSLHAAVADIAEAAEKAGG